MPEASPIIYTKIDEAPALATHSLLPILQSFTKGSGIELEAWDISLTGRIVKIKVSVIEADDISVQVTAIFISPLKFKVGYTIKAVESALDNEQFWRMSIVPLTALTYIISC